jgi:hypothetical protein
MPMKLDAPTRDAVAYVAARMRKRDADEFFAVSRAASQAELVSALVDRYGDAPDTFCAFLDETPIAVGAMVEHRPNVVTLMFFATDRLPEIGVALTRWIVQRLFPQYRARGVHRIECASMGGYEEVHRWIETLGLSREAVMPKYGKAGETFVQFAWVADGSPTGA